MAKLIKKSYFTSKGERKINNFMVSISKKIVEKSKINVEKNIKITAGNKKIIIENE